MEDADEVVCYLNDEGIHAIKQECWEHQRLQSYIHTSSLWCSNDSLHFHKENLLDDDPEGYETITGETVGSYETMEVPVNYAVSHSWSVYRKLHHTDLNGWKYSTSFDDEWSDSFQDGICVRKRLWQRVLVEVSQHHRVMSLTSDYTTKFRSFNPSFIRLALHGLPFRVETVLECQRSHREIFEGYYLTPCDPPQWSCADPNLDLTAVPLECLKPVDPCQSIPTPGWTILHDYIFTVHPGRDPAGWQYSDSFDSTEWTSSPSHGCTVRRRIWMRTVVKQEHLFTCRDALEKFISLHPRGSIFSSSIQRQSHYRKRWCEGHATLTDFAINVELENNYKSHVSYPIKGCEAVMLSHLHDPVDLGQQHYFLFGLLRIGEGMSLPPRVELALDSMLSREMVCVFNAPSARMRELWLAALTHQLALINLHHYEHRHSQEGIGPPTAVDLPVISGRLFRRGEVMWKLRDFELRRSGVLACYKRGRLARELSIDNCFVRIPDMLSFEHPFEIVDSTGSVVILLAATNEGVRQKWMEALRARMSNSCVNGEERVWYESIGLGSIDSSVSRSSTSSGFVNNSGLSFRKLAHHGLVRASSSWDTLAVRGRGEPNIISEIDDSEDIRKSKYVQHSDMTDTTNQLLNESS